jgi:hypothetical protein
MQWPGASQDTRATWVVPVTRSSVPSLAYTRRPLFSSQRTLPSGQTDRVQMNRDVRRWPLVYRSHRLASRPDGWCAERRRMVPRRSRAPVRRRMVGGSGMNDDLADVCLILEGTTRQCRVRLLAHQPMLLQEHLHLTVASSHPPRGDFGARDRLLYDDNRQHAPARPSQAARLARAPDRARGARVSVRWPQMRRRRSIGPADRLRAWVATFAADWSPGGAAACFPARFRRAPCGGTNR